jgi:hypothetical protein
VNLLQENKWIAVYIWAPIGLWFPSEHKDRWLKALRTAFIAKGVPKGVTKVAGVFGGPEISDSRGLERSVERLCGLAGERKECLKIDGSSKRKPSPGAEGPDQGVLKLYYLPPAPLDQPRTAAPGCGAILFKHKHPANSVVLLAFTAENSGLNAGTIVRHEESNAKMIEWFENQMIEAVKRFIICIVDGNISISFREGMADFLSWYPECNGWKRDERPGRRAV